MPLEKYNLWNKITYATGELLLVIVGILIALQIENWNEERKIREQERIILSEIKTNLELDLQRINRNLQNLENNGQSIDIVLSHIEKKLQYHDSLSSHFAKIIRYGHFPQNTSGYELLKSKGLETVANITLRKNITLLYERYYEYLHTIESERYRFNYSIVIDEYLNKFKDNVIFENATPVDYRKLCTDNRFLEVLRITKSINSYVYNHDYKETKSLVENLINEIDKELKSN